MDSTAVTLSEVDGVAVIEFNRPAKRNAVNREMRKAIMAMLQSIRGKHHVCIIKGSGGSFCAGVDLKEYEQEFKSGFVEKESEWSTVLLEIRAHPAIFIAAVEGYALGGGLTLIGVCDLALASRTAQIGMPEIRYGMYPTMAGPASHLTLPRKVAALMILTGQLIDGDTAERWNLVNRATAPAELLPEAHLLAQKLVALDPVALAESKKTFDVIPHQISGWSQAFEYAEGVNAQIERQSATTHDGLARFSKSKT
jgi:enoyl-CoA hydratase/carnithine racemase